MPDVAAQPHKQPAGTLDWVGMNNIEMPVRLPGPDGEVIQTPARISAFVDLIDPEARGIHMSRLYLHLQRILAEYALTP
ncbi:MAG: GTP cyclohydrolase, FolE2/MptA family, partial [Wenzhouxiangellaceae bacterium]